MHYSANKLQATGKPLKKGEVWKPKSYFTPPQIRIKCKKIKHSRSQGVGLRMPQNPEVIKHKTDKFDDRSTFSWGKQT